jgi:hypothetical protein
MSIFGKKVEFYDEKSNMIYLIFLPREIYNCVDINIPDRKININTVQKTCDDDTKFKIEKKRNCDSFNGSEKKRVRFNN